MAYQFNDRQLICEALRHSSYMNEHSQAHGRDNERLEFLGDAVISLAIGHILMEHHPDLNEGQLSRTRAGLVNEQQLAAVARSIDLGPSLLLGKGELSTSGHEKDSILADAFEAVIAAVYLDGGYPAAYGVVETHFRDILARTTPPADGLDYKSRLQELAQASHRSMPEYRVTGESGPDHAKTFEVRVKVIGLKTSGSGKSKKLAEQDAARQALEVMKPNGSPA